VPPTAVKDTVHRILAAAEGAPLDVGYVILSTRGFSQTETC
jgi:hypothetical protein